MVSARQGTLTIWVIGYGLFVDPHLILPCAKMIGHLGGGTGEVVDFRHVRGGLVSECDHIL